MLIIDVYRDFSNSKATNILLTIKAISSDCSLKNDENKEAIFPIRNIKKKKKTKKKKKKLHYAETERRPNKNEQIGYNKKYSKPYTNSKARITG